MRRRTFRSVLRRSRRKKATIALFFAPVLIALAIFAATNVDRVVAAPWKDPLSMFADRSPGERRAGTLVDTKPLLRHFLPRERVLAAPRQRPPGPLVPGVEQIEPGPGIELPVLFLEEPGPPTDLPEGPPTLVVDTGGPPVVVDQPTVPGVPAPVPEPATWIMSILGMFGVAFALRRRNRAIGSGLPQAA